MVTPPASQLTVPELVTGPAKLTPACRFTTALLAMVSDPPELRLVPFKLMTPLDAIVFCPTRAMPFKV